MRGRSFGISKAEGVSRSRLRASDLWIPTPGTRLPTEQSSLRDRCAAHQLTLPAGAAFSHLTAARRLGLPLPRPAQVDEIDVTVPRGTRAPRRKGVVSHQRVIGEGDVIVLPTQVF